MFKTLDDIDCRGRRILVRGDLNVPVRDGAVTDTTRLDRLAPTLLELAEKGAKVVVLSHFGRPKGEVVPELTLRPIADALSVSLGGRPVAFADDCIGDGAATAVDALADGDVLLLENLRFDKRVAADRLDDVVLEIKHRFKSFGKFHALWKETEE